MSIIDEIEKERARQVDKGFDVDHDDHHRRGQLSMAACCYATARPLYEKKDYRDGSVYFCDPWPWSPNDDRRGTHTPRQRLIIAAALLVAEIERLDRADVPGPEREGFLTQGTCSRCLAQALLRHGLCQRCAP